MLPVLLSAGPFMVRTLNVLLAVALVLATFVFWRKGKEEHYDEVALFDGFLVSIIFGLVWGRVVFIGTHWADFGFSLIKWLDVFTQPGLTLTATYIGAGYYLARFARKYKWDVFEILDFWILAVTLSLIFVWAGFFFEGSGFGVATTLPWGLIFPGVFTPHHPVQIYYVLFYIALFWYLSWVEFRYRTFSWYRAGKNTAQTGFLISMFLLLAGIFSTLMTLITVTPFVWRGVRLDLVLASLTALTGAGMVYVRSGRTLPSFRRKK